MTCYDAMEIQEVRSLMVHASGLISGLLIAKEISLKTAKIAFSQAIGHLLSNPIQKTNLNYNGFNFTA